LSYNSFHFIPFFIIYLIVVIGVVESGEIGQINRGWWVEKGCKNRVGKTVKKLPPFPTTKLLSKVTHKFENSLQQVFRSKYTAFTQLSNIQLLPN
jgi:hypothetical protein